eukprot:TRINITY_DN5199_c0_g3_i1.p2 TRINITY_DN5199_c0_g3~~TRINITY_DN5199_c0_g3_i1.p2  ORF type:complete len:117 (-),score=11.41 TRINITY_DN5199_c0_g3_i1:434-784(-)
MTVEGMPAYLTFAQKHKRRCGYIEPTKISNCSREASSVNDDNPDLVADSPAEEHICFFSRKPCFHLIVYQSIWLLVLTIMPMSQKQKYLGWKSSLRKNPIVNRQIWNGVRVLISWD